MPWDDDFRPALIVVDVQEDFCPPNGSLAVPEGRDIVPMVNQLLALPFAYKVATKDWHPPDHVSFASNHSGKKPFQDFVTIVNEHDPGQSYQTRLWPVHCVQGSPGAELLPELDVSGADEIIEKGQNPHVEMYSAFWDPFKNPHVTDSGLCKRLTENKITHVYVVGLAGDYCVKFTAVDASHEKFVTYVVEEATRPVDADTWPQCKEAFAEDGVKVISFHGPEVQRVREG